MRIMGSVRARPASNTVGRVVKDISRNCPEVAAAAGGCSLSGSPGGVPSRSRQRSNSAQAAPLQIQAGLPPAVGRQCCEGAPPGTSQSAAPVLGVR